VPLVVLRAPGHAVRELLGAALHPRRPYEIVTRPDLGEAVMGVLRAESTQVNMIYGFQPSGYRPVLNVMVQPGQRPFQFEVRVGGRVVSGSGVNWQSPHFAEMYVYTEPSFQGRGWGRAVGSRCVQALLEERLLPLYTVAEDNSASQSLARTLGFRDSGAREFSCRGQIAL
jgi:GNAT superfamily N-acetyltransferase